MRKYLAYMSLVVMGLLTLTSCHGDSDEDDGLAKQTIIVFDSYTEIQSSIDNDLAEMKDAMKATLNNDAYRVVLYKCNTVDSGRLFEIVMKDGVLTEELLTTYSDVSVTDRSHLMNVLTDIKRYAPAQKYKMIGGGHGSGWLPSQVDYSRLKRSFGASREAGRINVSDFAYALKATDIKLDLLVLDYCLMGNIETAYEFGTQVKYIIASPGEQVGDGFNYSDIWNDIIAPVSVDVLSDLCQKFVDYGKARYKTLYETEDGVPAVPITVSAIDCSELWNVANAMIAINTSTEGLSPDLLESVQRYDGLEEGVFYDILSYAEARIGSGYATDTRYITLKSCINKAVPVAMNTGYFLGNSSVAFPIDGTFCGLATSDPSLNEDLAEYKTTTYWWQSTH